MRVKTSRTQALAGMEVGIQQCEYIFQGSTRFSYHFLDQNPILEVFQSMLFHLRRPQGTLINLSYCEYYQSPTWGGELPISSQLQIFCPLLRGTEERKIQENTVQRQRHMKRPRTFIFIELSNAFPSATSSSPPH